MATPLRLSSLARTVSPVEPASARGPASSPGLARPWRMDGSHRRDATGSVVAPEVTSDVPPASERAAADVDPAPAATTTATVPDRLYGRDFTMTMVSQTCFVLASTTLTHYARYVEFLGGTVVDVGWIMGIGPAFGLLLRPWLAQSINRLGAKPVWVFGLLLFMAGQGGNLLIDEVGATMYVLRASLFLGGAIIAACSLTMVTQIAPPDRRTEAIATLGAGGFVAMLMGPLLGDLILSGTERTREQFVALFGLGIGLALASLVLLAFVRAGSRPASPARTTYLGFVRESIAHWPGSVMLVNLAFGVSMAVPFAFLASFIDEAKLDAGGWSTVGVFFAGYAGWGLFVRLMSARWPEKYGRDGVMVVGLLSMGTGLVLFPVIAGASAWWLLLPAVICGTGHALVFPTMTSLTLERFPAEVRGTGSALCLMTTDLGMVVGSPILGVLAIWLGYSVTFAVLGVVLLGVACHYYWVHGLRGPSRRLRDAMPPLAPPLPIARALPGDLTA